MEAVAFKVDPHAQGAAVDRAQVSPSAGSGCRDPAHRGGVKITDSARSGTLR